MIEIDGVSIVVRLAFRCHCSQEHMCYIQLITTTFIALDDRRVITAAAAAPGVAG